MITLKVGRTEYRFFDHLYAVSRSGKVLRKLTPVQPINHPLGYLITGHHLVHRMVATCWVPNPKGAKLVHHKNGNKRDNRADNLEWVTQKEHMGEKHAGQIGHYKRTEETRRNMSLARMGWKDSEATRLKKAATLAINCPKTPCRFQGKDYPSVAAGARAAGINKSTFRQRYLSKYFPDYELLPR